MTSVACCAIAQQEQVNALAQSTIILCTIFFDRLQQLLAVLERPGSQCPAWSPPAAMAAGLAAQRSSVVLKGARTSLKHRVVSGTARAASALPRPCKLLKGHPAATVGTSDWNWEAGTVRNGALILLYAAAAAPAHTVPPRWLGSSAASAHEHTCTRVASPLITSMLLQRMSCTLHLLHLLIDEAVAGFAALIVGAQSNPSRTPAIRRQQLQHLQVQLQLRRTARRRPSCGVVDSPARSIR